MPNLDQKPLGFFIRKYQKEHHLTQTAMANKLNIALSQFNSWITGRNQPNTQSFQKLIQTFDLQLPDHFQTPTKPTHYYISKNIQAIAAQRNLTLNELQKQLKIPLSTIYNMQKNKKIEYLKQLCPVLNCSVDQLLGLKDQDKFGPDILKNCYQLSRQLNLTIEQVEVKAHLPYHALNKLKDDRQIQVLRKIARYLKTSSDAIIKNPNPINDPHVQTTIDHIDASHNPVFKRFETEINHQGVNFNQFSAELNITVNDLQAALSNHKNIYLIKNLMRGFHLSFAELRSDTPLTHRPYVAHPNSLDPKLTLHIPDSNLIRANQFIQRLLELQIYLPINDEVIETITGLDTNQFIHQITTAPFAILYASLKHVHNPNLVLFNLNEPIRYHTLVKSKTSTVKSGQAPLATKNEPKTKSVNANSVVTQPTNDQRLQRLFNDIKHLTPNQLLIINDLVNSWRS